MKKTIILIAIAALLVFMLCGCGDMDGRPSSRKDGMVDNSPQVTASPGVRNNGANGNDVMTPHTGTGTGGMNSGTAK